MARIRGRIDQNQKEIVSELRQRGLTVQSTANLGKGFPDICVGFRGYNFLFEIKKSEKDKLTKDELTFHQTWAGQIDRIETAEQAIKIILDKLKTY